LVLNLLRTIGDGSAMRPTLTALCLWACFSCLTACGQINFEWQGPSDYFRGTDANHDGELDRREWDFSTGTLFSRSYEFRHADCDMNGRLSWHEYFRARFRSRVCPGPFLYQSDGLPDAVSSTEPEVAGAGETIELMPLTPDGPVVPTLLTGELAMLRQDRRLAPLPGTYSERDLDSATLQHLRMSNGPLTSRVLVSRMAYDDQQKGPLSMSFPRMNCEFANQDVHTRVTLADFEILWRARGHEYRSRQLKPVWVDPLSTQTLFVWFKGPADSAECHLLRARGQPAA
jgi:hypothetical protein